MQNPFLRVLRASFEDLYRRAAERGEATMLLVPCAECLEGEGFSQIFIETHVLQAACVPGCFMNLCGQGIEIKDASVSTHLGFTEHRTCEVLQTESMFDFGGTFRVLVIDRPLIGRYRTVQSAIDRAQAAGKAKSGAGPGAGAGAAGMGLPALPGHSDQPAEWLNSAPAIQDALFDEVDRFRKTFVQVPGCEQSTAERIREIVDDAVKKLVKHHQLIQPTHRKQLELHVSRNTYAVLHSFVFPHLQRILSGPEERLERGVRSYATVADLLGAIPGAQGRGLGLVDLTGCCEQLAEIDHKITPHEKIACIDEAHSVLQRCIAEGAKVAAIGGSGSGAIEITGDDVLSLFILAAYKSSLQHRLAHIAHVEMYLQGSDAQFQEGGYAVSALQAALQFFLEERRHADAAQAHTRSTTNIFASYLQPAGGGSVGGPAIDESDADLDRAGMHLQGLVRQARAQGGSGQSWR